MEVGGAFFVLSIIAMGIGGSIVITWLRTRHGYAPTTQRSDRITTWLRAMNGADDTDADRKIALLSAENEKLIGRVGRLEERIAVLERIVTDPGHATARAIEELR